MLFSEPYFRPEKGIRILMLIAIHLSLSMGDGDGSFFWKAHPVVGQNSQEIHHYNPKWSKTTCYRRPTKLKAIPVDAAYNLALSPDYIRTHQGLSFHRRFWKPGWKTLFYLAFSILLAAVFLPTLSNQYACPAENLSTYEHTERTKRFRLHCEPGASWNGAREREHARGADSISPRVFLLANNKSRIALRESQLALDFMRMLKNFNQHLLSLFTIHVNLLQSLLSSLFLFGLCISWTVVLRSPCSWRWLIYAPKSENMCWYGSLKERNCIGKSRLKF